MCACSQVKQQNEKPYYKDTTGSKISQAVKQEKKIILKENKKDFYSFLLQLEKFLIIFKN